MRSTAARLAEGMRAATAAHNKSRGTGRYRATVISWTSQSRFELEAHGVDLQLDEEDVTLGQTVRAYDVLHPIHAGDALILVEVAEGDYVAVDVESEED